MATRPVDATTHSTPARGGGMDRRGFLSNAVMLLGLSVSYLTAFGFGLRYLFPSKNTAKKRIFIGLTSEMLPGSATAFRAPDGHTINVIHGPTGFRALSNVCPHLGCTVKWDPVGTEFVCPCHDGHFDADGVATAGPPADMGANLPTFEVFIEGDLVFLDLPEVA